MRYTVTGLGVDAAAGRSLIERLGANGLAVDPSYRTIATLEEVRRRLEQASSSDLSLLLLSRDAAGVAGSLVRLDEVLSLRRGSAPCVQGVLLEGANAPTGEVARLATLRGAATDSATPEVLLQRERRHAERIELAAAGRDIGTFAKVSHYTRLARLALLALIAVVLMFASEDGLQAFLLFAVFLALFVLQVRSFQRRRDEVRRRALLGTSEDASTKPATQASRPVPSRLGVCLVLVGVLAFIVASTDRFAQRIAHGRRGLWPARFWWEYGIAFGCTLLGLELIKRARRSGSNGRDEAP